MAMPKSSQAGEAMMETNTPPARMANERRRQVDWPELRTQRTPVLRNGVRGEGPQSQTGRNVRGTLNGRKWHKGAEAPLLWLTLGTVWPIVFTLTASQVYLFRVMTMLTCLLSSL